MATRRLFVAVELAPHARAEVSRALEGVRPLAPRARWVSPDKLHLTLQFLGAVEEDRLQSIQERLDRVATLGAVFPLELSGAGTFGRPASPSVLWLGATQGGTEVAALARWVGEQLGPLGFTPNDRAYVPHLTLARAAGHHGEPAFAACVAALSALRLEAYRVERLVLRETLPDGRYTVAHESRLPCWHFAAHTSEVQLELEAGSLAGVLAAAARGYGELVLGAAPPWAAEGEIRTVAVEAPDDVALLVRFLDELVFLSDTVPGIPVRARVTDVGGGRAQGEITLLRGEQFKTAVKAATLHGAACGRSGRAWTGRVVLDV